MKGTWTTERVNFLKAKWGILTSREIADTLGHGITRNSVLGKANRLRLPISPFKLTKKISRKRPEPIIEDTTPGISMMELTETTCRWPSGDPRGEISFCGKHPIKGSVYCSVHYCQAHAVNQSRFYYKEFSKDRPDPVVELEDGVR